MERIVSKDNERIKLLAKLQKSRRTREESGTFVAEGVRLAREVLAGGLAVRQAFATEAAAGRYAAVWEALCQKAQEAFWLAESLEEKISDVRSPQGIYCICDIPRPAPQDMVCAGKLLALDRLQDPGNLGTILRTADAFGAGGVILGGQCADCFSPKVVRSTMGSVFRLPVWQVEDLARTLLDLRREGFVCFGAALDETARRLGEVVFPARTVAVIGNEGNGISPQVLAACQQTLYIPMKGKAESLNAGVAASLILWEMCR